MDGCSWDTTEEVTEVTEGEDLEEPENLDEPEKPEVVAGAEV